MAWGGSLNKEGSDHVKNLREAGNAIKFLERLKQELNDEENQIFSDAINIIVNHYTKESKNESQTLN